MQTSAELKNLLQRIDHKGYPAYKDTRGSYEFPGYVLSIVLGGVVLGESVTAYKAAGVAVILLGLVLLSAPEKKEDRPC